MAIFPNGVHCFERGLEMEKDKAIELASRLLKITIQEAEEYCHRIDNPDVFYFSVPTKGGDSLIVENCNEVLYANSSVNYDDHIKAFKEGMRTPLEAFEG